MDKDALEYTINHIFLPPKLPQEDDSADMELQRALLQHIAKCAKSFCEGLEGDNAGIEVQDCWKLVYRTLKHFAALHSTPNLSRETLEEVISGMQVHDVLCFHIQSQNAGVILRRREGDILVEFFQASPSAPLVTGTKGKLAIQYPFRPWLSIPADAGCIRSFSALLGDLDCTSMPDAVPKTRKAGSNQDETRDVPDIRYVSELLGGIARALTPAGSADQIASNTVYVTKRINDHVLWKSALLPWRRSPKWLIIRVALQTTFAGWNMPAEYGYKMFITFVLAKTLELAVRARLSDDLLFIMNSKIANRMWKLRSFFASTPEETSPFSINDISHVITSVEEDLRGRWEQVQALEAQKSTWVGPSSADVDAACRFTLPRSSAHFETVKARGEVLSRQTAVFDRPSFEEKLETDSRRQRTYTAGVSSPDLWFLVFDLEQRLSSSSPNWGTLSDLADLIVYYDEMASSFKTRNPEIFSRIFLLVLELWVVLDTCATRKFSLLLDYPPELSIESFEPLLLPELGQMQRLHNVERHLTERYARVRYPHLSVFTYTTNANSLPFRYFDSDSSMQTLRNTIQSQASARRSEKIRELQKMNADHAALREEIRRLSCEYSHWTDRWGCRQSRHDSSCRRCAKEREADGMRITLFEWPLPEQDASSRLVMFELCVPAIFGIWRDTTYYLAKNNSEPEEQTDPPPPMVLADYLYLKNYLVRPHSKQRITIASTAKSFYQTHYRGHSLPCYESAVIQDHPLRYRLWDRLAGEWLPSAFSVIEIRPFCTPDLAGPYRGLKWSAIGTAHTPNDVVARQSECPRELSYHEWENFGHLRAGVRLQWRNIILQLISGTVDLASPAVHILLQQAAWQAETALEDNSLGHYREAHLDLSQEDFGIKVVDVLGKVLASIAGNWQEGWTAASLAVVACRLVSLTPHESVKHQTLRFLVQLRQNLFTWMEQVLVLLNKSSDPEVPSAARVDLVNRVIQLAASCRQTYAVGPTSLREIFRDRDALSIFIRCAITLHTNVPPTISSLPSALRYLVERDVLIATETLELLVDAVARNGDGLDDAILGTWQGFRRASAPWRMVGERWIACMTFAESSDTQARFVHLNLHSGSLLVDGQAQGTLPKEIVGHSFFRILFPNRSHWYIVPSTMKGMHYQLRDDINGFQLHFKLDGNDLLIRIRDGSNFISEFIPPKSLKGDLPASLISGMVHIFHERSQFLEIYAAPCGWQPLAEPAWHLDLASRVLSKNGDATEFVLDPVSPVVRDLSTIFRPLEECETNLTVSFRLKKLYVKLPRYDLEFSTAVGEALLGSKELPGFFVASIQSVGTLIGLQNKLVLRSTNGEMMKLFIPDGRVTISRGDIGHPRVTISPSVRGRHIKVFTYDVDDILGRVAGDGSLTSWYQLAFLHAATTSHFADPLLSRTGICETQEMLGSAQAFAFMRLENDHHAVLQQILDLVPTRKYYPAHLTSMETVEWNQFLPVLVQCGRFVPLVNAILDYSEKQALFDTSDRSTVTAAYEGKLCLWERADVRVARLVSDGSILSFHFVFVSLTQISVQLDGFDMPATPIRCLESPESTAKEHDVAQVVSLVCEWPTCLNFAHGFKLWSHFEQWNNFSSKQSLNAKINNHRDWLKLPPPDAWFQLFHICRASLNRDRDQCGLMVALGILAYRKDIDLDLIRTLITIATNGDNDSLLHAAGRIPGETFNLGSGRTLALTDVSNTVAANCHRYHPDSSWMERWYGEEYHSWTQRRENAFRAEQQRQCGTISDRIFSFWPAPGAVLPTYITVVLPDSLIANYPIVKIPDLRAAAENLFTPRLCNRRLFERSDDLQGALDAVCSHGLATTGQIAALAPLEYSVTNPLPKYVPVTLSSLLTERSYPPENIALRELIRDLEGMPGDGLKPQYIADLKSCVHAFETKSSEPSNLADRSYRRNSLSDITQTAPLDEVAQTPLLPRTRPERWLYLTGHWPSTGPQSLLHQLSRGQREAHPEHWKCVLRRYAEKLAVLQQRRRIDVLTKLGFTEESAREAGTVGGQGWDPATYPDWLLIQLDADILIRPLQANIAMHMMAPESRHNALMQLNMGEGKSSVIVPIISSALADGQQLVRVVVLKPLAAQMFQLLKQRVCGLANRRVFYLPFSRDIPLNSAKIQKIFDLFKECARSGGILLCQPEHILSFQLMGLHAFSESETGEETCLLRKVQCWLDRTARDILDESDEILNVRYQLIYTVGASKPLDGRPWRWQITQAVFSLLQTVAKTEPDGLEIGTAEKPCQFPVTRILTSTGSQSLLPSIVRKIIDEDGLQEWISFRNYSATDKATVSRFLQQVDVNPDDEASLREISGDRFRYLLLLRGLFAHGIVNLSLREKRWRVDYGLDTRRTMLAVPYRAKDSPAPRAEFGHPDVIIVLTCLSYYYGGLTDSQLDTSFRLLLNSDNPEAQYEYWVKGINDLPAAVASLRGLNLDDFEQKTRDVFPLLRYNKTVVDFYLSECVFPKEAREFEYKLTTNAWDLARTRERLTTGFSGTNDNKYLLPLSIEQCDQDSQRHTNAQVLQYVLQKENRRVICTNSEDALGLLQRVVRQLPPVMVLLDVGAQVLELENEEVAREWLKLDTRPEVEAAVYFDPSTDEIRVVARDGRVQPFVSSLYKKQLGKTLVYLDEAHTRGTDFKFPEESRAVVTLGPRMTKDKLVQGCMRMRRLGKDHFLLFFASKEIQDKVIAATGVQPDTIDSKHVLLWTMKETCAQIQDNGSLWANQGLNFDARHTALQEYDASSRPYASTVEALRERESHTLDELYGIASRSEYRNMGPVSELQRQIQEKCNQLGITPSDSALSEEQERELAHEKEDERELERVVGAKACDHHDRDLEHFVNTGIIRRSNTFISPEDCLAHTSWISLLPQGKIFRDSRLRATRDFRDTILLSLSGSMDNHLRPVQWVMSTAKSPELILVSPFEANKWLPTIRSSKNVYLHLYSPRTSRNTFWPLDRLDSFTVPTERGVPLDRQLLHELSLFAGQLFCADKRSMKEVCAILGLCLQSVSGMKGLEGKVDSTGFVRDEEAREELGLSACSFVSSPLPFFRDLLASRRKGQGFSLTHMGQILRGNDPKDPAFEEGGELRE
ncbi:hypothetical protein DFH08DRAFT_1034951 [Mycena albidolilacea]|uniref:ubiquitinyl hydrolase 1 n=1 Tax=Mycena albidolilacea TaxID=1033008 RepID=A0AAD6ZEG5_9AGAR|nr:hypothetical protein DFH08DRAFT_1034951 [Mycena albidolilacea]